MDNIEDAHEVPAGEAVETVEVTAEPEPYVAPVPEPEPTPVQEPAQESAPAAEPEPVPAPAPAAKVKAKPAPARHVVTDADADPVYLSSCVYQNKYARKSLTVHHLQRRLVELGYKDAEGDKDGWYGELTAMAVKDYQKDCGLEPTGMMDADTFTKVFANDPNVEVNLN
jgi:peptidoglycan hydrolase-like protein with peptidoglycan-binding domain